MSEEAAVEDSDQSDFEFEDDIKEELNSLMNLDFIDSSSDDEEAREKNVTEKKGDKIEEDRRLRKEFAETSSDDDEAEEKNVADKKEENMSGVGEERRQRGEFVETSSDDDEAEEKVVSEKKEEKISGAEECRRRRGRFAKTSSDDDEAGERKSADKKDEKLSGMEEERRSRGDSLERELEMMFQQSKEVPGDAEEGATKDTGLESISDNELDGPESGECDTSDGELPDSPNIVVVVPDTPPIKHILDVEELSSSDVELVGEYQGFELQKSNREVIIETREPPVKTNDKSPIKIIEVSPEKVNKDKKERSKKKSDVELTDEEKRRLKLEKYLARFELYKAKCREYMKQMDKKRDKKKKGEKVKTKLEKSKSKSLISGEGVKLKSIVKEVSRDISPISLTSSKFDKSSHSSRGKSPFSPVKEMHIRRSSSEKEHKSKRKKSKSKSKELNEHRILYQEYLYYLQLERRKCLEEGLIRTDKPKKSKKRKRKSKSPDKKEMPVMRIKGPRPPILTFSEFCNSRELVSPDREIPKPSKKSTPTFDAELRKERTVSIDSAATTATVKSDPVDPVDEDKELFITITDLEQQDKMKKDKKTVVEHKNITEPELEKCPERKGLSVFSNFLFKGSSDSEAIPFLSSECRPSSPKPAEVKPKKPFIQDTGIDEIYDMNDDLSNISQSSLSPSRSPVPKLHNKALLNYLENQKARQERLKNKSPEKKLKSSRSRSKSPRRERSRSKKRKRKHNSSMSTVSPSPPPLRPRTPENDVRKRQSPPAYLKERWKDYPSPPELRLSKREHRKSPLVRRRSRSRTRKVHRSRSSSEERERHFRRYKSRSRSRSRSKSRSPPVLTMVQLTAAEKRRKLREEHERALASLRESIRKPLSTTAISLAITNHGGDNFETICDNYDPVGMNEVRPASARKGIKNQKLPATVNPLGKKLLFAEKLDSPRLNTPLSRQASPPMPFIPPKQPVNSFATQLVEQHLPPPIFKNAPEQLYPPGVDPDDFSSQPVYPNVGNPPPQPYSVPPTQPVSTSPPQLFGIPLPQPVSTPTPQTFYIPPPIGTPQPFNGPPPQPVSSATPQLVYHPPVPAMTTSQQFMQPAVPQLVYYNSPPLPVNPPLPVPPPSNFPPGGYLSAQSNF